LTGHNLGLRHAADEMGPHVFRLRIGRVVHIAADVEVVVVRVHDLGFGNEAAVLGQFALVSEDVGDLLDVLGAELILILALGKFAVGVDEEDFVAQFIGLVLVHDQNTSRDAGAVEESGRQADDGLDHVVVDEDFADEFLFAAAEEDAVRHDGGHVAA